MGMGALIITELNRYPGAQQLLRRGGDLNFGDRGGVPEECHGKHDTTMYIQVVICGIIRFHFNHQMCTQHCSYFQDDFFLQVLILFDFAVWFSFHTFSSSHVKTVILYNPHNVPTSCNSTKMTFIFSWTTSVKTATTFTKIQRFTHFAGREIILYYLILSYIILYYHISSYIILYNNILSQIILYHFILSYNELLNKNFQYQGRLFQYKLLPELLSGPNNKAMKPNLCQKQQPSNLCRLCSWKRTGSLRWSSILGARSWALLKMQTHWILREAITQKTNTFLENLPIWIRVPLWSRFCQIDSPY